MKAWDTNFLLRHLLEDDAGQLVIVREQLTAAERSDTAIFLPQIVLVETSWYLRSLLSRTEVLDVLAELLTDRRFSCERAHEVDASVRAARKKGDFSDHLIAAAATAAGAVPVLTFDKALKEFPAFEVYRA
jgi:predicted nucleic-acid-binding protein